MLRAYKYFTYFLIPLIKLHTLYRVVIKKEEGHRIKERYGISKINRPKGNLIWIHASSVGEFNSTTALINELLKSNNILLTTSTVSAYYFSIKFFGDKIIHQYAPIDHEPWINKFIKHWNPNLVIWIESDLWPNTIRLIAEKKINSILLNLRISPKSFNKWKIIKKDFSKLISYFNQVYVQSVYDLEKIKLLTNKKINFIGNLKLTSLDKDIDENKFTNIKEFINSRKTILIASTHRKEEEIILNVLKKIYDRKKNIFIIVCPRHPERSEEIEKITEKLFFHSIVREDNNYNKNTNCLINKSFGEMNLFYKLSDIVILGGSFTNMGGHNPIEPAKYNCNIISGPSIFNWYNVYQDMIKEEACIISKDINDLYKKIINFMDNKNIELEYKKNAIKFSNKQNSIVNDTINIIKPYIHKKN